MPNKIINTPDLLKGFPSATSGGASSRGTSSSYSFSSANLQEIRSSNPDLAKGVIGTRGAAAQLSPKAFSKEKIESLVASSGATTNLRKRAVRIAFSYVGANEVKGQNLGWFDAKFQTKMENLPQRWKVGNAWCACFTNLVWIEAFTTGNAYVPSSNNTTWSKTLQDEFKSGKYLTKDEIASNKFFDLSKLTANISNSFKGKLNGKYFISKSEAKSGKKLPQPGDIIRYDGSHVEIITKVYTDKKGRMTKFDSVTGNSGSGDLRNGGFLKYIQGRSIDIAGQLKGVTGFCVLSDTYS